jgi:hypothetical protein
MTRFELATTRPPDVIFTCKYLNFSYLKGVKMTVKKCPIFAPNIKCLIKTGLLKKKNKEILCKSYADKQRIKYIQKLNGGSLVVL